MAHKRKDTYAVTPEWWKHLRPFNKRRMAKRERVAKRVLIGNDSNDVISANIRLQYSLEDSAY